MSTLINKCLESGLRNNVRSILGYLAGAGGGLYVKIDESCVI